jgi:hypothetical protein
MTRSAIDHLTISSPRSSYQYWALLTRGVSASGAAGLVAGRTSNLNLSDLLRLHVRARLYALVLLDGVLRKSPLSLVLDKLLELPSGSSKGLSLDYLNRGRRALYELGKDDPCLQRLMERFGWGGDPNKEMPSALELMLWQMSQDVKKLLGDRPDEMVMY